MKVRLNKVTDFKCATCINGTSSDSVVKELVLGEDGKLECVDRFCYLGDMIGAGGGVEEASRTRVRCAWGKFRELSPILIATGASLKIKGKIYKLCVQSVLVYARQRLRICRERRGWRG